MSKFQRHAIVFALVSGLGCTAVQAQTSDTPAKHRSGHAKSVSSQRPKAPALNTAGPAANLNAPSTDFSNVEAETGEPKQGRQRGPNVRPGIDGSGRPVMGLGF